MSTIFSRIVEGEIPARVVYEDENTFAFLDANPLAPGHTLVIPREEYERLNDVPDDVAADLYATVHDLIPAVEEAVDAPATTVAFNNGEAAGQEVPHVHCHIVPRFEGDGGGPIHAVAGDPPELGDDELDDIAERISANGRT
jgi:histidine triad (HIT) family protein